MADWIGLAEAAYALDGGVDDWLAGICDRAHPLLDLGVGVAAYTFHATPTSMQSEGVAVRGGPPDFEAGIRLSIAGASEEGVQRFLGYGTSVHTMSEAIFDRVEGQREFFHEQNAEVIDDVLGVLVLTGGGRGMSLAIPLPSPRRPSPQEKRHLGRIGAHLAAGIRLRDLFSGNGNGPEPEAVLDPDGKVHDAQGEAKQHDPRERLRVAVKQLELARTRKRRGDPESLSLWEGLVRGRWSLVDRFESDGRRFVVAHRNEPNLGDPRGLSPRELHVAELVGNGCANKEIAYELGLSESSVANAGANVRRKLGLHSRVELAAFFAPGGLRARLSACEIEGESFLVGAADIVDANELERLTAAEREVALYLLRGATNSEISRRRGTSEHTTANQIKALYERLGVDSRVALAARMSGESAP